MPLDMYDDLPENMIKYLRSYGFHFNKKAYDFAVSMMRRKNEPTGKMEKVEPYTREQVMEMLKKYGVSLENDAMYDSVYVAMMGKADYLGSSIPDEAHLAKYVKDVIDDADAPDGCVFNSFYAKCVRAGIPIEWEDLL